MHLHNDAREDCRALSRLLDTLFDRRRGARGWFLTNRQLLKDLIAYCTANSRCNHAREDLHSLFKRFLFQSFDGKGLHLRFGSEPVYGLAPNWMTLDLAPIERLARESGLASIDVEDDYFNAVFLSGLNRLSRPASLIAEIRRTLRSGGQVWVQVPLNRRYQKGNSPAGEEFWRITPEGLRVLFERFDEIMCDSFLPNGSALESHCFYYGIKPAQEPDSAAEKATASIAYFPI